MKFSKDFVFGGATAVSYTHLFATISYFKNTKFFFNLLEITFVKLVITFSISASGRDTFHEIALINSFLFVLNKKELY